MFNFTNRAVTSTDAHEQAPSAETRTSTRVTTLDQVWPRASRACAVGIGATVLALSLGAAPASAGSMSWSDARDSGIDYSGRPSTVTYSRCPLYCTAGAVGGIMAGSLGGWPGQLVGGVGGCVTGLMLCSPPGVLVLPPTPPPPLPKPLPQPLPPPDPEYPEPMPMPIVLDGSSGGDYSASEYTASDYSGGDYTASEDTASDYSGGAYAGGDFSGGDFSGGGGGGAGGTEIQVNVD